MSFGDIPLEITSRGTPVGKFEDDLEKERIQQAKAETAYYKKLTAKEDLEIEKLQIEVEGERRYEDRARAEADEAYIYPFYGAVDKNSVNNCMQKLGLWARREPGCKITIILNSPGGSVTDGLALYDFLRELSAAGHHIEVVALGMAASMGGILLQAGDTRVIGSNAFMLIHEVSTIALGSVSDIEDEQKFVKRLQDKCVNILAEKSNMTPTQIKRVWKRKDVWMDSAEVLEKGFADQVR
jgi:ATP-dependent Clp endopeptidase proteolytic subunit ClpP